MVKNKSFTRMIKTVLLYRWLACPIHTPSAWIIIIFNRLFINSEVDPAIWIEMKVKHMFDPQYYFSSSLIQDSIFSKAACLDTHQLWNTLVVTVHLDTTHHLLPYLLNAWEVPEGPDTPDHCPLPTFEMPKASVNIPPLPTFEMSEWCQ
jgi:hypothetical protein